MANLGQYNVKLGGPEIKSGGHEPVLTVSLLDTYFLQLPIISEQNLNVHLFLCKNTSKEE